MVREKPDNIEDGAAETMLDGNEKEQLAQKEEVKFISADHKNGDAKIDIGGLEKVICFFIKLNFAKIEFVANSKSVIA